MFCLQLCIETDQYFNSVKSSGFKKTRLFYH
jgi:hypothetical protein